MLSGEKIRWVFAATGALLVVTAAVRLFRLPDAAEIRPALATKTSNQPSVQMARATATDAVLREETEIRDLRPLFLPTKLNATLPEPRREAGRTFLDNETLKLGFSETEFTVARNLPPVVSLDGKPIEGAKAADLLSADVGEAGLVGFGRIAVRAVELPARGGFLEVFAAATGQRVIAETLPAEVRPPGDKAWEPFELMAAVSSSGLAAPLVVTASSRVEEVDSHFRNYLSRRFRIGERLPPGFYRILVGP